jgi:exosortase
VERSPNLPLSSRARGLSVLAVALAVLLWAYWTTLAEAARQWEHDPQYSHGYLVPVFAAFLLWTRRKQLVPKALRPSWWGAAFLGAGLALRVGGTFFHFEWFDPLSLLPSLAGLCLLLGGWAALRWSWPAILFLFFMIPLPYTVSVMLAQPMQNVATVASTFVLQTLGWPALSEGNVILINDVELNIVEACSGLRMLVIFFALSTAVVLLVKRPALEKAIIVLSSLPIALVSNVLRITLTGVLHDAVEGQWAHEVFHDLAGWLMMPLALALLAVELRVLSKLFVEPRARFAYGR